MLQKDRCAHLHGGVSVLDVVLQVAHQHQVSGLEPAAVQGMMVDVAQDGAGADAVCAVFGVDELTQAVHDDGAVLALALLLILLRLMDKQVKGQNQAFNRNQDIDIKLKY